MDPSLVVAEKETFFFQQSLSRRAPKRYRKQPEDLPHDLRFAHLNPRVAAYLASKEKEQKIPNEFDDGLGNKSLLPQINQTVSLIRHRLDSFLSSESDAQRVQFEETKARSSGILDQLARLLSLFEGLKVHLPASLEQQLLYSWKELTAEAKYSNRDWQIPANKEAYEKSQKSDQSSRGEDGKDSEPDDETRTSEGRRNKSKTTGKTTNACHSREESLEGRTAGDNTTTVRLVEPGVNNLSTTNKTRDHYNKNTARSRMTSSKSRAAVQYPGDYRDNRPASAAGSRCSLARGKTGIRAEDTMSVLAESMSDGTRSVAQPSFVQTIQFQLSSKACDERGWIVHQGSTHDKEMKNVLEWATQRLQACKRHRAEEKSLEEEMYLDQQPTLKFYGDGQKEQIQKYKGKGRERLFTRLNKDQSPKIPKLPDGDGRPLLMATTCDGSSTIFYPDGRPAIVSSRSSIGKPGYYTFVYDDSPEQKLLAMFTPSGRSCCYHDNGVIHFLTNESGGTMAENNGAINKRWTWPSHGTKLPVTISFHINSCVLFKCSSQTHMQLSFSCQKEQVKMNVGMTPGAEDPPTREDMGHLLTGIVFSSHTSKEFSRPYKPKTSTTRTKTKAKGKMLSVSTTRGSHHCASSTSSHGVHITQSSKPTNIQQQTNSKSQWNHLHDHSSDTSYLENKHSQNSQINNTVDLATSSQEGNNSNGKDFSPSETFKKESQAACNNKTKLLHSTNRLPAAESTESTNSHSELINCERNRIGKKTVTILIPRNSDKSHLEDKTSQQTSTDLTGMKSEDQQVLESSELVHSSADLIENNPLNADKTEYREVTTTLSSEVGGPLTKVVNELDVKIGSLQYQHQVDTSQAKHVRHIACKKKDHLKLTSSIQEQNKSPIPASELQKLLADLPMEKTENDANADKELIKLNRKVRILTEDWLEHYRIAVGMMAPQLKSMNDVPFRKTLRNINSAKSSPAGGGIVIIESPATQVVKATLMYRAPSAPVARCERPHSATSETVSEQQPTVKFVEAPPEEIEVSDQVSVERMTPFLSTTTSITGSQGKRTKSAPLHGSMCNVEALAPSLGLCTGALRQALLGEEVMTCRCSRHHIPAITDIEYDTFIQEHLPHEQLLIISVVSSIFPDSNRGQEVLQKMYSERNKNRAKPCLQSRGDPFRILLYDMATAANSSDHTQPLLLRRHNVVAGMFLMYQAGKLLFCDHIFNGYGNERKDLEKQMIETRKLASLGHSLPNDFHFSPQHGRHGLRSPWGGEIGGAGVDRHGSAGLSLANLALKKSSGSSSESSETSERQYAFQINGMSTSLEVVRNGLDAVAISLLPSFPKARRPEILQPTTSRSLPKIRVTRAKRNIIRAQ